MFYVGRMLVQVAICSRSRDEDTQTCSVMEIAVSGIWTFLIIGAKQYVTGFMTSTCFLFGGYFLSI